LRSSNCFDDAFAGFVGGALLGGGRVVVGAAVVGAVDPVQAVPLSVKEVGAGLVELFHEPLNPNDVFAPVAMGAL
jgi:hypothetical protein